MSKREVSVLHVYIIIQSAAPAVAVTALCVATYTAVVAAAVLLLPAAVCHRVPDGQILWWFTESDPSVFLLFIQTRFTFHVPLGSTVSHLQSRFTYEYILGNCGHERSQGGRQPAAAKPPLC